MSTAPKTTVNLQIVRQKMAAVEARGKEFEAQTTRADPYYERLVEAIVLVKQFIRDRGLIIYGGTAIDFCLRLRGASIYPDDMLAVPDLDFLSPDSIRDAYDLTDLLFAAGYKAARTVTGIHVQTMRVDAGDNHFIADLSYVPPAIFKALPTIIYDGMRVLSPTVQAIDMFSSLSFPYDEAPREVIFARWAKDIKRFNLLYSTYRDAFAPTPSTEGPSAPAPAPATPARKKPKSSRSGGRDQAEKEPLRRVRLRPELKPFALGGFSAYAVCFMAYEMLCETAGVSPRPEVLPLRVVAGSNAAAPEFEVPAFERTRVHLVHFESAAPLSALKSKGKSTPRFLYAHFNFLPERVEYEDEQMGLVTVDSSAGRVISYSRVAISAAGSPESGAAKPFVVVSAMYICRGLLASAAVHQSQSERAGYMRYFESMMRLIEHADEIVQAQPPEVRREIIANSPFYPSVQVYGLDNKSDAYNAMMAGVLRDLHRPVTQPPKPQNYYPGRAPVRPSFALESSPLFKFDGAEAAADLF